MPSFYVFEVRLLDVKPRIWRKFALFDTTTFDRLHWAIQDACGWQDYHLFRFHATEEGPIVAGIPDEEGIDEPDPDARLVKLRSYFTGKSGRCFYQYDFGDDWWHEVKLVDIVDMDGVRKRALLDGALSFPPEDCGGTDGYERCVACVNGKGWEAYAEDWDREELKEWIGRWKPDGFKLATAKKRFDR